jgi:hypothetical protein
METMTKIKIIFIACVFITLIGTIELTNSLNSSNKSIGSSGIFSFNSQLIADKDAIDWGTLTPPAFESRTVKFTNMGNAPLTLTMTTTGKPENLSLTWNGEDTILPVGNEAIYTFTLQAPYNYPAGAFSFIINVNGVS